MNHRTSKYASYLVGVWNQNSPDWQERRRVGLEGPQRDFILLDEAEAVAGRWIDVLLDGGSIPDAKRLVDEARKLLEPLKESDHLYVSHVAARTIGELPSQQEISDFAKKVRTPTQRDNSRLSSFGIASFT